ncbi:diphthamide synthesis protein [Candidatus Woesearchaeota archaeon]|nr:diphthamide synthesis protein [Candidatus Woesearchaeota archaeon]
MKTLFIHSKSPVDVLLSDVAVAKLPLRVALVTNIQHLHKLGEVKRQLQASGREVFLAGQILGCRAESAAKFEKDADAFLYVGSGVFHPLKVAMTTKKPVFCWNPKTGGLSQISEEDRKKYADFKLRQLNVFYNAAAVGVLISTKQGQSDNKINSPSVELKLRKALQLKARKDRQYFLFAFDTLSVQQLEDFPFIECWVNTACSRIADEKINMVNVDDIVEHENSSIRTSS